MLNSNSKMALPTAPSQEAPGRARAAVTGGGAVYSEKASVGGGPPPIGDLGSKSCSKCVPTRDELRRLSLGYSRLRYLLDHWEEETTVCIRGCKGKYENCGCTRDPIIVQSYMGYKSMNDPLFKVGNEPPSAVLRS